MNQRFLKFPNCQKATEYTKREAREANDQALESRGPMHCSICQKTHGSPFSAFAAFPTSSFNIIKGSECLSYFQSSENVRRSFCSNCGSKITFEHK